MPKVRSIPALIIGALLLAGCAAPAASPSTLTVAVDDPTPVPTAMVEPTTTVAEPDAPDEPGAPDGDSVPFFTGSVVKTVADEGLRVRSEPGTGDDSFKFEPLLPLGTPLLLLDGPVSGSGYEWYEVAPLSSRSLPGGWIASASREGKPWISPSAFDCPSAPTDMRSLRDLPRGVGVHCFSNEPITVKARLISCECDVDGGWYTPHWFAPGGGSLLVEPDRRTPPSDVSDWMDLSLDPEAEQPDDLPLGEVVEVTGVFDHPAASDCTLTDPDADPVPSNDCRLKFAVTRLATDE
jgi:hypothetical protein